MTEMLLSQNVTSSLSKTLLLLLAITAGLAVASLYYTQPLLGNLMTDLSVSAKQIGSLPTLTQVGYAFGMLLLNPLGDRYNRRKLILFKGIALIASLMLTATAQGLSFLMFSSLFMGLTATLAQDVIPLAAGLAPQEKRGQIVGTVMTGLLCGILLSRVLSGSIGELFGWRTVFYSAAACVSVVIALLYVSTPDTTPTNQLKYHQLLISIGHLFAKHAPVRRATYVQALISAGFSAFWTTLALMLKDSPLHMGSSVAGIFGLLGAFGAVLAPKFGKLADKKGPLVVSRMGCVLTVSSFLIMLLANLFVGQFMVELAIIALATILFDLGVQMSFISHQTICYQTAQDALSRVNSILIFGVFIGMSSGSFIASYAYQYWGWSGVIGFSFIITTVALLMKLREK